MTFLASAINIFGYDGVNLMRVSKEKAAENRQALLEAASRKFRKDGIDGVGVAEIANEAGLTHGAIYAHFPSKEALAAEAFSFGFAKSMEDTQAWANEHGASFDDFVKVLMSRRMRDKIDDGCPMTASASEISRQSLDLSLRFKDAFEELAATIAAPLTGHTTAAEKRRLSVAAVAAQIGAIAVARAVLKADEALSEEVLSAVRETFLVTP
ncbi:TetR/AcrR family transcriptional regulator [Rhizobium sp. Rhizsp82]|uniref:TetR/AcrR family transcriptional regulator n=1 Tax=Rhizobium sp. Rhizsp82 TaxID=3243057 RepID=UPI0039B5BBFC